MMLSDKDLTELAINHRLVVPFIPDNCKGATINLTLDSKIKRYNTSEPIVMGNEIGPENYEEIDIEEVSFYLKPRESVLIKTVETFNIPDYTSGQIYERYSIKLMGLSISPASYLNPGYRGTMSFVVYNQSCKPIMLVPGIKFSQLALTRLTSDPEFPYSKQDQKYMDAKDVDTSKLHLDVDIQGFLKDRGVGNISSDSAKELGKYLMDKIKESTDDIVEELKRKFGDPNERQS